MGWLALSVAERKVDKDPLHRNGTAIEGDDGELASLVARIRELEGRRGEIDEAV
jgi:hypothetical protein